MELCHSTQASVRLYMLFIDSRLLPPGEQGRARLRRGTEQQNPRPPASRVRAPRRRVPAAQDPHVHAPGHLTELSYPNVLEFTHTTSRRAQKQMIVDSAERDVSAARWGHEVGFVDV